MGNRDGKKVKYDINFILNSPSRDGSRHSSSSSSRRVGAAGPSSHSPGAPSHARSPSGSHASHRSPAQPSQRAHPAPSNTSNSQTPEDNKLPCPQPSCTERLTTDQTLQKHLARMHPNVRVSIPTYTCTFETPRGRCRERFVSKGQLDAHLRRHHAPNPKHNFVCSICGMSFHKKTELERHQGCCKAYLSDERDG